MPLTSYVPETPLASYRQVFAEHATFDRRDGVLHIRFHTNGEEALWSMELHKALPQIFRTVGADPENEIVIISGTGDHWVKGSDIASYDAMHRTRDTFRKASYDLWYHDGTLLQEHLIHGIPVPTIAAINGPGFHSEIALFCDLTIAADHARLFEPHFHIGLVPGDGMFLALQHLLGPKRANHIMYLRRDGLSAQEALELGLVNEVVPSDQLLDRAFGMAEVMMRQPRVVRRLTTQLVRRPWRKALAEDLQMHLGHELFAANVSMMRNYEPDL